MTETKNNWIRANLLGVKNLKLANGAKVEVKAGARYQKQTYRGSAAAVRTGRVHRMSIRCASPGRTGMIQNELKQAGGQGGHVYKEAQRLSGSCPMIFTWNGQEFEFITDVLGVAPLGASAGRRAVFPARPRRVHPDSRGALWRRVGDQYEIRITEELREVSYLDQVQLIALDHPAADRDLHQRQVQSRRPSPSSGCSAWSSASIPPAARDHRGASVLPELLRRDRQLSRRASRRDYNGTAELHHLDLDFGKAAPDNRAILILNGWVDWADGSTFLAASQEKPGGLVMPYLQVKDAQGKWRTVIEDMGIPAGKPKTIAVDLTGQIPLRLARSPHRHQPVRLLGRDFPEREDRGAADGADGNGAVAAADLRFRGFSRPVIHPERKQPEQFRVRPGAAGLAVESDARPVHAVRRRAAAAGREWTTSS